MRRRDREITEMKEILHILDSCQVIRIGMQDEHGVYILPMNFGYTYADDKLTFYLHTALEGKKLELIRKCSSVGFELDCDHELVEGQIPCQYGFRYASVIGNGVAEIVENPIEKMDAMTVLMQCQTGKEFAFNEKLMSIVSVIKVTASSFSGKRRE